MALELVDTEKYLDVLADYIRKGKRDADWAWLHRLARTPESSARYDLFGVSTFESDLRQCFNGPPNIKSWRGEYEGWTYFNRLPDAAHRYGWLSSGWGKHSARAKKLRAEMLAPNPYCDLTLLLKAIEKHDLSA